MEKTSVIILAAGHGKRMNHDTLPKVLIPFRGKPMIHHVLAAVEASGVDTAPVIVVGQKAELVKASCGPRYTYVFQDGQRGTGHAVAVAHETLEDRADHILVLYGDMPLITPQAIRELAAKHAASQTVITMATITVDDFNDWRKNLYDFGRVIRDRAGHISAIVEKKDATPEQLTVRELNPSYFCFNASWLWENISALRTNNTQGEYYLTDLVHIACGQKNMIASISIDPREGVGINTAEQLELAGQL